jgi:hypothetical protein
MGGAWTDFEIKASTNNFAGGDMVYFYASGSANDYGADDPDAYTYYCDDFAADVRKWVAVAPHTALATVLKFRSGAASSRGMARHRPRLPRRRRSGRA